MTISEDWSVQPRVGAIKNCTDPTSPEYHLKVVNTYIIFYVCKYII